ncbi:MAG: PqqD family protein [Bacteroidota bacterium]
MKNQYTINKSILIEHVDNEFLLLDSDKNTISIVNASCMEIIDLIRKDKALSEIVEHFISKYDVEQEEAQKDILEVIQNLESIGVAFKK